MKPIPKSIENELKKWSWMTATLRLSHLLLGITAIISSLLVAAKINSFQPIAIEWLAFLAAVSVALMSGFDLGAKANSMRRAWRLLNAAIIRFQEDPNGKIEAVVDAYERAEEIIGDVKEKVL